MPNVSMADKVKVELGLAPPGLALPASAFDNSAYCGAPLFVVAVTMIILNTGFVAFRFYTHCILQKAKLSWDDWFIIPAYILNLTLCTMGIVTIYIGHVGKHEPYVWQNFPEDIPKLLKSLTAIAYVFFASELFPRLSVCCLYLRIFSAQHQKTRIAIWSAIVISVAVWISYTIAFSFACRPFAFFWDRYIPGGYCYNANAFYKSLGFPGTAIDIALIVIPIPSIYSLKLPDIQKLGICFIFLTGSLGMMAGIVRMAIFFQADPFQGDATWGSAELQVWTIVEPGMYLIAACLPVMRPLIVKIAPSWMGSAFSKASQVTKYMPSWPSARRNSDQDASSSPHLPKMDQSLFRITQFEKTHSGKAEVVGIRNQVDYDVEKDAQSHVYRKGDPIEIRTYIEHDVEDDDDSSFYDEPL